MITRIVIPQLFENMEEATLGAWLKPEGATVSEGEAVCELITEKSTFELESPAQGVLLHIVAPAKSIVPVQFIIGLVGDSGDDLSAMEAQVAIENAALRDNDAATGKDASASPIKLDVPTLQVPSTPAEAPSSSGGRVRATPAARRAARDKGVSIEDVAAANPGKVLSEEDVARFAS